jgi:hypothetical protein
MRHVENHCILLLIPCQPNGTHFKALAGGHLIFGKEGESVVLDIIEFESIVPA